MQDYILLVWMLPTRSTRSRCTLSMTRSISWISGKRPVITLFNKQDAVTEREPLHDLRADHTLAVSAREGTGLDELKELLAELLRENKVLIERTIAYADAGILQQIRKQGELLEEDYRPEGIYVKAYVPLELYGKL